MSPSPRVCPMTGAPARAAACPEAPACRVDRGAAVPRGASMPRDGVERAAMLALRFVAAAADTGDAACFDAAFDVSEAEFGSRDGALLVARAAALVRALRRENGDLGFLPPPCRFLSAGEADLLGALRLRLAGHRAPVEALSGALRAALADLTVPMLPYRTSSVLPPAAMRPAVRLTV